MDDIPVWFKEARLNFAENLLWCRRSDKTAIVATGKQTVFFFFAIFTIICISNVWI
jgi:hypothetical protein